MQRRHLMKFNATSKTLNKISIEETFYNIVKAIYDKPNARIILNANPLCNPLGEHSV